MPAILIPGQPYDTWTTILNACRFRVHEKLPSLYPTSGGILDATQEATLQACRNAFRVLQERMTKSGANLFNKDIIITGIPPVANTDPASRCSLSWFGFFDGSNFSPTPALPADILLPLWMAERWTGDSMCFPPPDRPNMKRLFDGLRLGPKLQFNGCWTWEEDTIYFPGSTMTMDFRIYGRRHIPDVADGVNPDGSVKRWFNQDVPVMWCQESLVWLTMREFAIAEASSSNADAARMQGMMNFAALCDAQADNAVKTLVNNRDTSANQRGDVRRIPYGGGRARESRRRGFGWMR